MDEGGALDACREVQAAAASDEADTARAALQRSERFAWAAELLRSARGGHRHGHAALAPYDAIYVGGACEEEPTDLLAQLAPGGRLLACIGPPDAPQALTLFERPLQGAASIRRTVLDGSAFMYGLR